MSLKQRLMAQPPPAGEDLRRRLEAEWRNPHTDDVEPFIIEESGPHRPTHVYVIWEDWSDLNQQQRSEIVMDAFEEVRGRDEVLNVSVAMGLTPTEARRMGIVYQ